MTELTYSLEDDIGRDIYSMSTVSDVSGCWESETPCQEPQSLGLYRDVPPTSAIKLFEPVNDSQCVDGFAKMRTRNDI